MCSLVVGMVSHVHTYICYIHIYTKAHQIVHIKYVQFTYVNYTLITLFLKRNKQVSLLGPSLQPSGQSPHSGLVSCILAVLSSLFPCFSTAWQPISCGSLKVPGPCGFVHTVPSSGWVICCLIHTENSSCVKPCSAVPSLGKRVTMNSSLLCTPQTTYTICHQHLSVPARLGAP